VNWEKEPSARGDAMICAHPDLGKWSIPNLTMTDCEVADEIFDLTNKDLENNKDSQIVNGQINVWQGHTYTATYMDSLTKVTIHLFT
jgi:hypothetical protein